MARTRTASSVHDGDDHDGEHAAGDDGAVGGASAIASTASVATSSASAVAQTMHAPPTMITLADAQDELRRGLAAATHEAAVAAAVAAAGNDAMVQAYMNLEQQSAHIAAPSPSAAAVATQPPVLPAGVVAPPPMAAIAQLPTRCPPFRESYSDMGELRRELKVLSVRMSLPYYMQHSSPQRLEARCPTWKHRKTTPTSCEFVVSANRHTNGRVYVTRAVVSHATNCSVAQSKPGSYITAAALMETAKPFMTQAGSAVRPKDMAGIMKDQFGVSTSYMTAWRALSAFKQEQKLEEGASFMKIRGYLDAFVQSNAGSVAAFEYLPDSTTFARAFLCPKALQPVLRHCREHVLLSVFLITSAHGGVLMTATAQDAMGENVPLAIALAPVESDDNWRFFLKHLEAAVPDFGRAPLTFVHSRSEELQRPLHEFFPACPQSDAVEQFAHTPATRAAGSSSTAPAEHAFQWLESLCTKTPLMVLVGWVSKVASTLYQRHGKYGIVTSEYPPEYHALLAQYEAQGSHHEVLRIAENGYEVIDHQTGRQRVVDFAKQSCTCGDFDASRFPCLHVFLAIAAAGLERTEVIPRIFLMDSLKALYGGRITPIDVETITPDNETMPIPQPKTRGRPRKVQQIQQFGDAKQEKLACSVCGVKGHNKRTCKRVVAGTGAGSSGLGGNVIGASSDSGSGSGAVATATASHDGVSAGALHTASGAADDEDEEPTFLDSTYVDEEDLPFEHSALHHPTEHHQMTIVDASTPAALAVKQQPGVAAVSSESGSASPSGKKRKLAADTAAKGTAVAEPPVVKKLATESESSASETTTL